MGVKLVLAIVQDEDSVKVMSGLNKAGFGVTKLCSTGGFLKSGNTTLLAGVDEKDVDRVIKIIRNESKARKQVINTPLHVYGGGIVGLNGPVDTLDDMDLQSDHLSYDDYPIEVVVGGATVFVINVEHFQKSQP